MAIDAVRSAIERIRAGTESSADFATLHSYLESPDDDLNLIHDAVSSYLKFSPTVDWTIAARYATCPEDPTISAVTITMASLGLCPDERFWTQVEEIAMGVEWDPRNAARVPAILALSRKPNGCAEAREIIRHNLLSDWESVRDSAAIAAQRCLGRKEADVVTDGVSGRLIESVGSEVLNWIWPDRERPAS